MDIEERQIDDEWHNNKADCSRHEMFPNVLLQTQQYKHEMKRSFVQPTMVWPFLMSRISQRSIKTAIPIVITVKIPLTFDPQVHAMNAPVAISHVHHSVENSLESS